MFDVKVVYQQRHEDVDLTRVPEFFLPKTGPLGLTDWEKVYAAAPSAWTTDDIFEERGLSRDGVVVVVRPDQYVAGVFPLDGDGRAVRLLRAGVPASAAAGHHGRLSASATAKDASCAVHHVYRPLRRRRAELAR